MYVDFRKMRLGKTFYILAILPKKDLVQNKWKFKKHGSKNMYYLFQVIGKKKIYIYIHNHVVTGSNKHKTAFTIKKYKN